MKLVYLASPYTHPDPKVMEKRYDDVCKVASELIKREGIMVLSPIAHSHGLIVQGGLSEGWDFWREFDERLIASCDELYVLCIDGWRESVGLNAEMIIAETMLKPISFVNWSEQLDHIVITEYVYRG